MERRKIFDTIDLVQRACHALRARWQCRQRGDEEDADKCDDLRGLLSQVLHGLRILRSFEHGGGVVQARLYDITTRALEQVILAGCDDNSVPRATTDAQTRSCPGPNGQPRRPSGAAADLVEEPSTAMAAATSNTVVAAVIPATRWSDVEGCEEAIVALKQATQLPRRFPGLFRNGRRAWQRILLYGPPGTGKTLLASATAGELQAPLLHVSSADLLSCWVGSSERQVRQIFAQAAQHTRCVLFLDEIDALCGTRGAAGETEVARRLKTEFLLYLQTLPPGVTVLGATNVPWEIDPAIRRRFDRMLYVGLPSAAARRRLLSSQLRHVDHSLTPAQLAAVVAATEHFSAADVGHVVSQAVMAPLIGLVDATALRLATADELRQKARRATQVREEVKHRKRRRPVLAARTSRSSAEDSGDDGAAGCGSSRDSASSEAATVIVSSSSSTDTVVTTSTSAAARASAPHKVVTQRGRSSLSLRPTRPVVLHRHAHQCNVTGSNALLTSAAAAPSRTAVRGETSELPHYVPCRANDACALVSVLPCDVAESQVLLPPVTWSDFDLAIRTFVPSVSQGDLCRYDEWRHCQQHK